MAGIVNVSGDYVFSGFEPKGAAPLKTDPLPDLQVREEDGHLYMPVEEFIECLTHYRDRILDKSIKCIFLTSAAGDEVAAVMPLDAQVDEAEDMRLSLTSKSVTHVVDRIFRGNDIRLSVGTTEPFAVIRPYVDLVPV